MAGLLATALNWTVCGTGNRSLEDKVTSTLCALSLNALYSLTTSFSYGGPLSYKGENSMAGYIIRNQVNHEFLGEEYIRWLTMWNRKLHLINTKIIKDILSFNVEVSYEKKTEREGE